MSVQNYLAIDFGGGSGRGMLGRFDGERLSLEEVHRFPNRFVNVRNQLYWDSLRMYDELLAAVAKAAQVTGEGNVKSLGIDSWGTDYGLIDCNGQPIGGTRCVRNASDLGMNLALEKMSQEELYERTGCELVCFATLCILLERQHGNDPALAAAKHMLLNPDYFAYMLTGEVMHEYTMATTTMMFDPKRKVWDYDLLDRYHLSRELVGDVVYPASRRIPVSDYLAEPRLAKGLYYVPVATHDTGSAVAAAPISETDMFISSGTCSLLGVILDEPLMTREACGAHFTNEGTIDGRIRFLRNLVGMWVLQECAKEWAVKGEHVSWDELVELTKKEKPFRSLIDMQEPQFFNTGNMTKKIQDYCRRTGQHVPENKGQIARCIYESLALRYRMVWDKLQELTGKKLTAVRIFGGGSNNQLLNQMTANAVGCPVYVGPGEASCIGNLLVQAMAFGEVADQKELRDVVRRSFEIRTVEPHGDASWQEAYEKYCKLIHES